MEGARMKIRAEYVFPPIAFRQFDWLAVDDDTYDGPGCPCGWGMTKEQAVLDLVRQIKERSVEISDRLEHSEQEFLERMREILGPHYPNPFDDPLFLDGSDDGSGIEPHRR